MKSSVSWLTFSISSNCNGSSSSISSTTPLNLFACFDIPQSNGVGYSVGLITIDPVFDNSYVELRAAIRVTILPTGEAKSAPSPLNLTDAMQGTVVVSYDPTNGAGPQGTALASATVSQISQYPANLPEGQWMSYTTNCNGVTLDNNSTSCQIQIQTDPTKLVNPVLNYPYQASILVPLQSGDNADIAINFEITVPVVRPLTITSGSSFSGNPGVNFSATLTAAGGTPPYSWTVNGLPQGLTVNQSTGVISGIVSQPITTTATAVVRDSLGAQSSPQQITITIQQSLTQQVTQLFPHIVDGFLAGEVWQTDILLINTTPSALTVELKIHLDANSSAPATALNIIGQGPVVDIPNITIQPNGSVFYRTAGSSSSSVPFASGWAEVISNVPIGGQALFRRHAIDGKYYEGSVPLANPTRNFTLPFDGSSYTDGTPFVTGLAIVNTDSASNALVNCTAEGGNITLLGSNVQISNLAPLSHTAFVLQSTNPVAAVLGTSRGILICNSTTAVGVLGLRFFGAAALSSLPIITN
jgi:hypothetical protein